MADTLFVNGTTVLPAWLNDANTATYDSLTSVAGTNTITATGPLTISYFTGLLLKFIPANTNSGAVTINVSGLGAKAITKYGATALVAGDLVAGVAAQLYYDGTQFQLLNPQTFSTATVVPASQLSGQVAVANGGTGASTAAGARANLDVRQEGPDFSASRITTAFGVTDATFTEVIFNSEDLDSDGCYNPANGRFTPNVAGWYMIYAHATLNTTAGTIANGQLNIYKNGVLYANLAVDLAYPGLTYSRSGASLVQMNGTTDYVSIFVYIDGTAGTQNVSTGARFSGTFVRS